MAIRAPNNLYRGINAHLHSILQNEPGDWESFHAAHIADLRLRIERQLPPNYYAQGERGLQIRESDEQITLRSVRAVPDITLYTQRSSGIGLQPTGLASQPTLTLPVIETLTIDEEDFLNAVVIYEIDKSGRVGVPVTHIELLSSANKPPESGYIQYLRKREELLRSGLRLVEIDYLHQTRSPVPAVPNYRVRQETATPYTIVVSDPRPTLDEGITRIYGFHVDDPIPVVDIPLSGEDVLTFDFGAAYHESYQDKRYHSIIVDYAEVPERFDAYSPFDQERIRQVMARVAANPPE